ncbi:MAG: amidohydrolase, partial [Rhodopila sp.]
GGEASNIIPERVVMRGTARWFRPEVGDRIEAGMHRLAKGIAASFDAAVELDFYRHAPATVNDPDATVLAVDAARAVAGPDQVTEMAAPTMCGEDFA